MDERTDRLRKILFEDGKRFTQDTAVLPDVWFAFNEKVAMRTPDEPVELLITPYDGVDGSTVAHELRERLHGVAFISNFVVAKVTLRELVEELLPYTSWLKKESTEKDFGLLKEICKVLGVRNHKAIGREDLIWQVALNRKARLALVDSVATTKADAARRVFDINCNEIGWAVIDDGIACDHAAFMASEVVPDPEGDLLSISGVRHKRNLVSRVRKSFDLTRIKEILDAESSADANGGRLNDWSFFEDRLLSANPAEGRPHGTHVAGIIGGTAFTNLTRGISYPAGLCPDIKLYDFRVFDENGDSDEFTIIAALQFIRYLNNKVDVPIINGVNLSFSIEHKVEDFACGATPVCRECDRLVASGVVVVAAAGNNGYKSKQGESSYSDISITDPGNAESVITVGATHRQMPHTYGVSYFSSRGPTGDGRLKPDLVAPGEKITSVVPMNEPGDTGLKVMDGTSMAAPHVSGVAALLLAKYPEFRGKPQRVKEILMDTATDLKRERYFQGAGLVDALRALQSI